MKITLREIKFYSNLALIMQQPLKLPFKLPFKLNFEYG